MSRVLTYLLTYFYNQLISSEYSVCKIILPDFAKNGVNYLPKKEVLNFIEGFLKTFEKRYCADSTEATEAHFFLQESSLTHRI